MRSRTDGLIQPGVLRFTDAAVYLRVEQHGRNVGLLIETKEGKRHFLVQHHPARLGAVALIELAP